MTPVRCHSQPTQCAYIGIWRGGAARPLRTPGGARPCRASGRVAQPPEPPRRCALIDERRTASAAGRMWPPEFGARQAKLAGVACARLWSGRTRTFASCRGCSVLPDGRCAHHLAAAIISPRRLSPGDDARTWRLLEHSSGEQDNQRHKAA